MREIYLNLARRPYVNRRPVVRLATFLWLLGLLLVAANVWLYQQYFSGTSAKAQRLAEIDSSLATERAAISSAEAKLAGLELRRLNATTAFLNRKIEERAFSWSRLLDRLASLLPREARLVSLAPERAAEKKRGEATPTAPGEAAPVTLKILAEAATDETVNALVDAFFADPAFRDPNPSREARNSEGDIRIDLTVDFLPDAALSLAPAAPEASAEAPEEAR